MKAKATFAAPLFVLIIYTLALASGMISDKVVLSEGNVHLSVIILQILVFIIPAIIFCRLKGVGYSMKLNVKLFSPAKLGGIIVSALTLICGSILIRFIEIYLFKMDSFGFSMFDRYLNVLSSDDFLFTATAFAIVPAITEEFVFRAILLTEYNEEGCGAVSASVISALLSSMLLFSLDKLPIFFLAGIVFSVITYTTGSSLAAMLCHMIFNFYGIFAEKYVIKAIINPSNKIISIFVFVLLFLIFAFIMFSELEHMLRKTGMNGTPTPSYRLKKSDDGKTPDIAATEAAEDGDSAVIGSSAKMNIDMFFSPTFLLCILFFAVAVLSFG